MNIETMAAAWNRDSLLGWPRTKKTFRLKHADIFTKTDFDNKTIRQNLLALHKEIGVRKAATGIPRVGVSAISRASIGTGEAYHAGHTAIDSNALPWRDHSHLSLEEKRAALGLVRAAAVDGTESRNLMIAFLNGLLTIRRESNASHSHSDSNAARASASELQQLHHTQAAGTRERVTIDPSRYGQDIPNAGGGDCVIHALEGRDLTDDELLATRAELAEIRRDMPDTETGQAANASLLATLLLDTPQFATNGLSLMQGRHVIPNRVLADFQAIPGGYAGVETIEQWAALRRNHDKIIVSIEIEQRKGDLFRDGKRVGPSLSIDSKQELAQLDAMVRDAGIVLYLAGKHWQQIRKITTPDEISD